MGWLLACILAVLLFRTRRRLKHLVKSPPSRQKTQTTQAPHFSVSTDTVAHRTVFDLIVLHLELGRLRRAGEIDAARYEHISARINTFWSAVVGRVWASPHSEQWRRAREAAWTLLTQDHSSPLDPPPWYRGEAEGLKEKIYQKVDVPPLPFDTSAQPTRHTPPAPPVHSPSVSQSTHSAESRPPSTPESGLEATYRYAWNPTTRGALERVLQAVSGWPALIIPFLIHNLLWFISGLCFVAASIFLVSATTGFTKTLTSFFVLSAYTFVLLWGGYQLRRRRPSLEVSSTAFLSIGVLLVPLNMAAAVRLIQVAQASPGLVTLGISAVVLSLGGLYMSATLVSGVMDRALQGRHPHIFLALASLQLAVPVLAHFPYWPVLAFFHLGVLGLLAYGLIQFVQDWLHALFVEQRKIGYYAAGTLVYAALVSFVHLTWGYQAPFALPHGYYSPFLITLCGLLFYADAQLKQWVKQAAFLSRLSFAIYGLSVLALFLCVDAPAARVLTLVFAIGLYAIVTWQYATVPPLYLLLGCSGWLYSDLLLRHLPEYWHFFASLPGLSGLFAGSCLLLRRQSIALALVGHRVFVISILGVAAWSVLHAQPGMVAMGTALTVMGFAFFGLQHIPAPLFGGMKMGGSRSASDESATPSGLRNSPWLYTGTLAGVVAVAFAPLWTGLTWATQLSFGLVSLVWVWTVLGRRFRWTARAADTPRVAVLFNSAVLTLFLCLAVAVVLSVPDVTHHRALPILLALAGGIELWLSLELRQQWLFYGVLVVWGATGALVKLTYFPGPSAGITALLLAFMIGGVLWWIEHEPSDISVLRREQAELRARQEPALQLLGWFPVSLRPYRDIVCIPLQQALVLLWGVGLIQLGLRALAGSLGWAWFGSACLGVLMTILLSGRLQVVGLLSLALVLGLGGWLVLTFKLGADTLASLGLMGAVYALSVWRVGVALLAHPTMLRLSQALHLHGDRTRREQMLHWAAFAITGLSMSIPLGWYGLFTPRVPLLLTLVTGMTFWWLTGQWYQQRLQTYLVLGSGILGTILCYAWVFHTPPSPFALQWHGLVKDPGLGLTFTLLSLLFWGGAWGTSHYAETRAASFPRLRALGDFARNFYRKPLHIVATRLSLLAAAQQLGLAWPAVIGAGYTGGLPSVGVVGLAGVSLLLANHALGDWALSLAGIFCVALSVLWAQGVWFHGPAAFVPWLEFHTSPDQWLTLAMLSFGLACGAHCASRNAGWRPVYASPLRTTAGLTYSWALLGALTLFVRLPVSTDAMLAWIFLTLALGLFPLLWHLPAATTIRGIGTAVLLTAFVVNVLTLGGWFLLDRFVFVMWAFTLWGVGNCGLSRFSVRWPDWAIAPATWSWFGFAGVGCMVLWPQVPFGERLVTLGMLTGAAAYVGWQRQHSGWLFAAMTMGVVQLHAWWLLWVPFRSFVLLFPWHSLQLAGLTWLVLWLRNRTQQLGEKQDGRDTHSGVAQAQLSSIEQALSWLFPSLGVLALLVWTFHSLYVFSRLVAAQAPDWLMGSGDAGIALLAALLMLALGIRQARSSHQARWVYGVAVLGGVIGVYIRMVWTGLAPVQVWDTVALIGVAYTLFIIQRLTRSEPLLHVVMVLPLLALGTVPLQLASPHASGTLLTIGMLYLFVRHTTGQSGALYMGLLAVNAGIYGWVPAWASHSQVLQVYPLPAAASVLWLLHLHRHELLPQVLHSARLAAISILYVSATLDVFLRAELTIFITVLALSLAGIMIGIALRTRAFLYTGTTSFVLNIAFQLLLLFPEQRLGRAVVLLVLATVLAAGMLWFNAQRETMLQRVRIFRADLATWA